MENKKRAAVLGGGISGLASAYFLKKAGYDVTLFEKNGKTGGLIETVYEDGYLFERGSVTALETTPVMRKLIEDLELEDEVIYGSEKALKKYIYKDNKLHPMPASFNSIMKSSLFSFGTKLSILSEPFKRGIKKDSDLSVKEYAEKKFNGSVNDYFFDPLCAEAYAGRPEELSLKSAFPRVYELEQKYKSFIRGTVKSVKEKRTNPAAFKDTGRIISFKNGFKTLHEALSSYLGDNIKTLSDVTSAAETDTGYRIEYNNAGTIKTFECDIVVSAVPSYSASDIFASYSADLAAQLSKIEYAPLIILYLAFNNEYIKEVVNGYGFIVPSKENLSILNAVYSSNVFPDRAIGSTTAFTVRLGGIGNPDLMEKDKKDVTDTAVEELRNILKIISRPVFSSQRRWNRAVPQYNKGHAGIEKAIGEFENNNPGLFFTGNYRGGITFGDCLENAASTFEKIDKFNS